MLSQEEQTLRELRIKPYPQQLMENFEYVFKFFFVVYDWGALLKLIGIAIVMLIVIATSPVSVPVISWVKYKASIKKYGTGNVRKLPICMNCAYYQGEQCFVNESIPTLKNPASYKCKHFFFAEKLS